MMTALARAPAPPGPLPGVLSGWLHHHVCPHCAARLAFDPDRPLEHRCDACAITLPRSAELDGAWAYRWNAQQAAVAGHGGAAGSAVLRAYAAAYPDLAEHGSRAGIGRVQGQSLDEAVWMIQAARGYRVALAHLDAADRSACIERMFRPACALLRRQTSQVHNIHCWHAAAIAALAGLWSGADDLAFAEAHMARSLREGVRPDGLWMEGSTHYHAYALEAVLAHARARRDAGLDIADAPRLRAMARALMRLELPGGALPLINDGWESDGLAQRADLIAEAHDLVGGLAAETARCAAWRAGSAPPPAGPAEDAVDGIALVRRPGWTIGVACGPDGGSHDHPARPGLSLWPAAGGPQLADAGNPGYGSPLHRGWFKRSVAHATLAIDGEDQRRCDGTVSIHRDGRATVIEAWAEPWQGVVVHRRTVVGGDWICDRLRTATPAGAPARPWRWLLHGTPGLTAADGTPAELLSEPLAGVQRIIAHDAWAGSWSGPAESWQVALLLPLGGRIGRADGPGLPATTRREMLIAASDARDADVIMLIARRSGPRLLRDGDGIAVIDGRERTAI